MHLLYTGKLGVVLESGPAPYDGGAEKIRLAKLYVLAEKLQDVVTKNLVVDAMLLSCRQTSAGGIALTPSLAVIAIIYSGTPPGSPMRRMMTDPFSYRARSSWISRNVEDWPRDFLFDLAISLLEKRLPPTDLTKTCHS